MVGAKAPVKNDSELRTGASHVHGNRPRPGDGVIRYLEAAVRFVHRSRVLGDRLYGDAETELEYAAQMQWVTIDGDQVRPGPTPVRVAPEPESLPPVPAKHWP